MKIDCIGVIGIVHTKQKPYWYKRKGYYVGERWVRPKKICKYKTVPVKEPYLSGDIQLKVDADFVLGGVYIDENAKKYMCTQKVSMPNTISTLRIVTMNLGKTFSPPKNLQLVFTSMPEK